MQVPRGPACSARQPVEVAGLPPPARLAGAALLLECFADERSGGATSGTAGRHCTARDERLGQCPPVTGTCRFGSSGNRSPGSRRVWGARPEAILAAVGLALLVLLLSLVFMPYPLKMDAKGQLLPEQRRWIYTPVEGQVVRFEEGVEPGGRVVEGQSLVLMYDVQLENKLVQFVHEVAAAQQDINALAKQLNAATTESERLRHSAEKKQREVLRDRKFWELRTLRARTNAEEVAAGPLLAQIAVGRTVLSWDFRETLTNRQVKPSEPLLRIGDKERTWEVQLKIPQKHMGQVTQASPRIRRGGARGGFARHQFTDPDLQG